MWIESTEIRTVKAFLITYTDEYIDSGDGDH